MLQITHLIKQGTYHLLGHLLNPFFGFLFKKNMKLVKRFLQYYKPYKHLFSIDVISALIIAGLDLVLPRFTNFMISTILPSKNISDLVHWILILIGFFIVRTILEYVIDYWGHVLGLKMEYDMRTELYEHMQLLPTHFFDQAKTGKLMSRLVNDLFEISELAHHGPEDFLISIILVIGSLLLMFQTFAPLAIVMLFLVPLMITVGVRKNIKFRKVQRVVRERLADVNAQAENSISGIRVVKAFHAEEYEASRFNDGSRNFSNSRQKSVKVMAEFTFSVKFFVSLITVTVLFVGGYFVIENQMTLGALIEFLLYVQLYQQPISKISALIMMYNRAITGFERFVNIIDLPIQKDSMNARDVKILDASLSFENVTFNYEETDGKHVLKDLSFKIEKGQKVAFVGPSGGGKSTLCNLIPRFYDIQSGAIKINGIDIKDITLSSLRSQVGIVQQDVFLFDGTILENIRYGDTHASREAILDAAQKAEAMSFISELTQGIDTEIGERGVRLSGGQRQRIALARIFLKNPPLLILDEATSALDNITELHIQKTLDALSKDRTTLVIAHRLSTITDADHIYVISDKGILEQGKHLDLLKKKGVYAQLYKAQLLQNEIDEEIMHGN